MSSQTFSCHLVRPLCGRRQVATETCDGRLQMNTFSHSANRTPIPMLLSIRRCSKAKHELISRTEWVPVTLEDNLQYCAREYWAPGQCTKRFFLCISAYLHCDCKRILLIALYNGLSDGSFQNQLKLWNSIRV